MSPNPLVRAAARRSLATERLYGDLPACPSSRNSAAHRSVKRVMKLRTGTVCLAALLLVACEPSRERAAQEGIGARPATTAATTAAPAQGASGWLGPDGGSIDASIIAQGPGPEHCDWDAATFLNISWAQLGYDDLPGHATYVDDVAAVIPDGDAQMRFGGDSGTVEEVPADAIDTGITKGDQRLWVAPDGAVVAGGASADRAVARVLRGLRVASAPIS